MEDVEAPKEVKDEIAKRLKENGTIERLEKSVYEALNAAARQITNNSDLPPQFIHKPFENASEDELRALTAVFQYLHEKGLDFTYKCLLEEANYKETDKYGTININEILDSLMEDDQDDIVVVKPTEVKNQNQNPPKQLSSSESDSDKPISIDDSDSDNEFIDIDDEDDDDVQVTKKNEEPKKEEKVQPIPAGFQQIPVKHIVAEPQVINKAKFEINDLILPITSL